jgi:D-alanyl-D-alanine carboxypeptidase
MLPTARHFGYDDGRGAKAPHLQNQERIQQMKKVLVAVVLLACFGFVGFAQTAAQESPAAEQLHGWLTAFNTGNRATLVQFLEKSRPSSASKVDEEIEFRERTGGFEFKKMEESTATKATAILKEHGSDQFARIIVEVDATPAHSITKFGLEAIPAPAEFALPRLSESDAIAGLTAMLEKSAAADQFSGAALVAHDGKAIFAQAYGMADREKKVPNKLDTQFRIGSMNKMFTAVAILQLAQAGKLQLSDPVVKFLPDYANKDLASKVTIHHLLTHTGGTGDFFGPEFDAHRLELKTLNDYVKLYEKRGLQFEPGSKWEYSNYGFLLLGVVIEKVSGRSYYDYVREHVFKPAGMNLTDSLPENEVVAGRSVGYMRDRPNAPWTPNTDKLPFRGTSAGGGYSTVEDFLRFANALESHKLLDAEHTKLLITGKVDTPRGSQYAYGFMAEQSGMRCFGHGGGAPGMNGDLGICPESGYVIVVLANMDPPAAQRVADFVGNRLPDGGAKGR